MATIKGYAFYAAVQSPKTKYQKDNSKDPLDYEYTIDVVVDPKDAKAFNTKFAKQARQPITKEKFKSVYKVDVPEGAKLTSAGKICMVKMRTGNAYVDKNGETVLFNKPKVLFKNSAGKLYEDTKTLVGNGSLVMIQYEEFESKRWGTVSAKLSGLRVDELVPYNSGDDFSELGEMEDGFGEAVDELGEMEESTSGNAEDDTGSEDDAPWDDDEDDY